MRFVATKTPEQQSCLTLHRTRHLFIRHQTSVIKARFLSVPLRRLDRDFAGNAIDFSSRHFPLLVSIAVIVRIFCASLLFCLSEVRMRTGKLSKRSQLQIGKFSERFYLQQFQKRVGCGRILARTAYDSTGYWIRATRII